jgi:hypothetical protein
MAWIAIRDSLWFAPGVLTLCATVLAFAITGAERRELLSMGIAIPGSSAEASMGRGRF